VTDGKQVASDSQATLGDQKLAGDFVKVVRDESTLFCFSGTFCMFTPLVKWYKGGCLEDAVPKCDPEYHHRLWVFNPSLDHPEVFVNVHKAPYPIPLFTPAAMGSGADYALGALYAGATLKEAVRIASKLDVYTGGKITLYDVPAKATRGKTKNAGKLN
jgi:hypothetical protein